MSTQGTDEIVFEVAGAVARAAQRVGLAESD